MDTGRGSRDRLNASALPTPSLTASAALCVPASAALPRQTAVEIVLRFPNRDVCMVTGFVCILCLCHGFSVEQRGKLFIRQLDAETEAMIAA